MMFKLAIAFLLLNMLGAAERQAFLASKLATLDPPDEDDSNCFKVSGQCSTPSNSTCPTWFVPNNSGTCKCGESHHDIISCCERKLKAAVLNCYCVTQDSNMKEVIAGACFYNCEPHRRKQFANGVSMVLPCSVQELDNQTCRPFKRTGRLCGSCLPDHSPIVYSYNMSCMECPHGNKNWWKFILAAFGPLTLFYFFILLFKINAVSSSLHAVLFYSQVLSSTAHVRIVLFALESQFGNGITTTAAKVLVTLYGIWSLDFFRAFLPNICLNLGMLPAMALDYVIAIYPLALIVITYFLIDLYDRNFKPLVWMWKPVHKVLMIFQQKWNFKTSLIDAFATFFLLSFNKVISVSCDLLIPTQVYATNSSKVAWALYYDGSIDYFSKQHLPYAILALAFLSLFVVIPVVTLLFYHCRCFHKLLNCLPLPWYILHTFADTFQGCFKNGTEPGTRDCRWFAGAYFILRVSLYLVYAFTLQTIYFTIGPILLLFFVILLLGVQPYRQELAYHTSLNATFLIMIALLYISITGVNFASLVGPRFASSFNIVIAIMAISPLIYLSYIALHWAFTRRIVGKRFIMGIRAQIRGYEALPPEEDMPHRLLDPNLYCTRHKPS